MRPRTEILEGLEGARAARGVAVIIDVFRAFSLAPWALARGATYIVPVGTPEEALALLGAIQETALGFAVVDDHRAQRTGLPEVVFGQGKTPSQLVALVQHLNDQGHPALATRVDADKAAAVAAELPDVI